MAMSQRQKELEEKKKKLEKMRQDNEALKKQLQNKQHLKPSPMSSKQGKDDDLMSQVQELIQQDTKSPVKEKIKEDQQLLQKALIQTEQQRFQDMGASSISKKEKYEKLKEQSFVGEQKICTQEKYDQQIQVDIGGGSEQKQSQQFQSPNNPQRQNTNPYESGQRRHSTHGLKKQLLFQVEKKELTQNDTDTILNSQNFQQFFDTASKRVEKALESELNFHEIINVEIQDDDDADKTGMLKEQLKFFDQHYSKGRIITSLQWSSVNDLILASYSQNEEWNINDPVGVCLLWSLQLRQRPEFYCFCQSQVTSACFDPYSNSTIIGGLFNGQIVMWDLRAKTTPVQRTVMAQDKHSYPIYSINVVGSQNAHNLISVSNDGRLCVWDKKNLTQPQKLIDLKSVQKQDISSQILTGAQGSSSSAKQDVQNDINVSSLAFMESDNNKFYIGSEDGNLYKSSLHGTQTKDGYVEECFYGHEAIVTSLSVMPNQPDLPQLLQGLVLSSSFDWSVKLWNPRHQQECLWTFESAEDYVYDVCWNKGNPTLFSSVDGDGYIDLWDLGDLEAPLLHQKAENNAINKCCWNKDGSKLVTGNTKGTLNIYNLDQKLLKFNENKLADFEMTLKNATQSQVY